MTRGILRFHPKALNEWKKLDNSVKAPLKKKLEKLLAGTATPAPSDAISGLPPGYFKIKLRQAGYRLAYRYDAGSRKITVYVIAVGKRDRNAIYNAAMKRG